MKSITSCLCRHVGTFPIVLALFSVLAGMSRSVAQDNKNESESINPHLKKWQEKMSDAFREAVKELGRGGAEYKPTPTVSADFREQHDSYMLRLDFPHRTLDKVEVDLKGGTLRITAPAEAGTQRYEQSITLQNIPSDAKPTVERKKDQGLMVVTIPKTGQNGGSATAGPRLEADPPPPYLARDTETMQRLDRMRRDMDRAFDDSFSAFRFVPRYKEFFDEYRFGSTYHMEDKGNHFEVRLYLPDRAMENVVATVEGKTLKVEAKGETGAPGSGEGAGVHKAAYTQHITLPGPVNGEKMKVERNDRMMVVIVPKATPQ